MPHDKHGVLLAVGDTVSVECEVVRLTASTTWNVELRCRELVPPYRIPTVMLLNSAQVVRVASAEGGGMAGEGAEK